MTFDDLVSKKNTCLDEVAQIESVIQERDT